MKLYALYKGDILIEVGTKIQLANKLNVKLRTIEFYKTPTNFKRNKGKRKYLIELKGE